MEDKAFLVQLINVTTVAELDQMCAEQTGAGRDFEPAHYDTIRAALERGEAVPLHVPALQESADVSELLRNERSSVGAPGRWESLIPFWGSARAAVHDFQIGNWGTAIINAGLAISDVVLIGKIASIGGKLMFKAPVTAAQQLAREQMVRQIAKNLEEMTAFEHAIAESAEQAARIADGAERVAFKAERWARYQRRVAEGKSANWNYERWSNSFDARVAMSTRAKAKADAYQARLGWGTREVAVDVEGVTRRLDIADVPAKRAIEYKTGEQSLTTRNADGGVGGNYWELERDRILRMRDWDVKWVFEGGPISKPLLNALDEAGIPAFDNLGAPLNATARAMP